MKKRLCLILTLVFLILSASFMIFYLLHGRSITNVANLNKKGITKIIIITRSGMVKTTYENKKDINNIFKLLDGDFIAIDNHFEGNNAWTDEIQFYSGDKLVNSITSSINDFVIDGKWYKIVKGDFNEYKIDLLTTNNN